MPPDFTATTLLGLLLKGFTFTLSAGISRLLPDALLMLALFASAEFVIVGILWAYSGAQIADHAIWKVLGIGVLFWLIREWPALMVWIRDGMIQTGLIAGGGVLTTQDILDPGKVAEF